MKRMTNCKKKMFALASAAMMMVGGLTGCGSNKDDWEYLKDKGTLVIGYTVFAPMNYQDEQGKLIGFDTELAEAVCAKLGLEPEFVEIDWENKLQELNSRKIDCAWNGLTMLEELEPYMDFSVPYSENYQTCVIRKSDAERFPDLQSMEDARIGVESGSAGEQVVKEQENLSKADCVGLTAQRNTLLELKAGTLDVAVLDGIMALSMVQEGTDFSDLMVVPGIRLSEELYAVGFRENSPETVEKVNQALKELVEDGTVARLADKYPTVLVCLEGVE